MVAPNPYPAPRVGCQNCGGQLKSKPLKTRSGRLRLRGLYLLLGVCTLGILAVALWPVWPRKHERIGTLNTCTTCGLEQ